MAWNTPPYYDFQTLLDIFQGHSKYSERMIYRILLDYYEELWRLFQRNIVEDDRIYLLFGLPTPSDEVKSMLRSQDARTHLIVTLESKIEELKEELKSYPSSRSWQVYLETDDPLIYRIRGSFPAAQEIIKTLGMPANTSETYWLLITKGNRIRKKHKKYGNYAVEDFGIGIKGVKLDPETEISDETHLPNWPLDPQMPDPSAYKREPRYWRLFGGVHLVQVWRSRVFSCPLDDINSTVEDPFSLKQPRIMYFQETWHPHRGQKRWIAGLENTEHSTKWDLSEFYRDALRLLGYKTRKLGPYAYVNIDVFLRDFEDACAKVRQRQTRRPSLTNVALELLIDRRTLKKCLERFDIPWPPTF